MSGVWARAQALALTALGPDKTLKRKRTRTRGYAESLRTTCTCMYRNRWYFLLLSNMIWTPGDARKHKGYQIDTNAPDLAAGLVLSPVLHIQSDENRAARNPSKPTGGLHITSLSMF